MTAKGLLAPGDVEQEIGKPEMSGLRLGDRLAARAWIDPAPKARLLAEGKSAAAELGLKVSEARLVVVEDTPRKHNLIVRAPCSCCPRSILGQPPSRYISKTCRARAVREPRAAPSEFGLDIPAGTRARAHDSDADTPCLAPPMPPDDTMGRNEMDLAGHVTRDMLIGTAVAHPRDKPAQVPPSPTHL